METEQEKGRRSERKAIASEVSRFPLQQWIKDQNDYSVAFEVRKAIAEAIKGGGK